MHIPACKRQRNKQPALHFHPGPDSKPTDFDASLSPDFNKLWLGSFSSSAVRPKAREILLHPLSAFPLDVFLYRHGEKSTNKNKTEKSFLHLWKH